MINQILDSRECASPSYNNDEQYVYSYNNQNENVHLASTPNACGYKSNTAFYNRNYSMFMPNSVSSPCATPQYTTSIPNENFYYGTGYTGASPQLEYFNVYYGVYQGGHDDTKNKSVHGNFDDSCYGSMNSGSSNNTHYRNSFSIDSILKDQNNFKSPEMHYYTKTAYVNESQKNVEEVEMVPSCVQRGKESKSLKRIRTIFTQDQLDKLEVEFSRQQYMVGSERYYLANELNLSEAQVKIWFQNRRIKWRKENLHQQKNALARANVQNSENIDEQLMYGLYQNQQQAQSPLSCVTDSLEYNDYSN